MSPSEAPRDGVARSDRRPSAVVIAAALVAVVAFSLLSVVLAVRGATPTEGEIRAVVAEELGVNPRLLDRVGGGVLDELGRDIRDELVRRQRGDLARGLAIAVVVDGLVIAVAAHRLGRRIH